MRVVDVANRKPRERCPNGTPADPTIGFRAPPRLVETVKAEAAGRGVDFAVVAREALADYVCALANGREELRLSEDKAA